MHPQQNELFLRYEPTTEQPMPQSLLTHLLGKAEETHIYSGDSVQIRLPFEHVAGCMKQYRLEVRLTTGALVENVLDMTCQAMKTQQ
jgi:hypothetical protein